MFFDENSETGSGSSTSGSTSGSGDDRAEVIRTYVGVGVAILGNILISVALNIQKYSHNKNAASETKTSYVKRKVWWLGMGLMLFGELGNFLAYGLAPASIIAPLGTVALVSNAIIAPFALKEKFRTQDLLGIVLSIGGAVVVVIFADSEGATITPEELISALGELKFILYLTGCVIVGGILMWLSPRYGRRFLVIDMALVGIFGGYTVIATKAVSTLMQEYKFEIFAQWIFYVMLVIMIVTGILQVRYLQTALQTFDSTEVIPAQFVMFTLGAIICSGVLYDDFAGMDSFEIILFCVGCLLEFIGVFFITSGRKRVKKADDTEVNETYAEETPLIRDGSVVITGGDSDGIVKGSDGFVDHAGNTGTDLEAAGASAGLAVDDTFLRNLKSTTNTIMQAMITGARARATVNQISFEQVNRNYEHPDDVEEYPLSKSARPHSIASDLAGVGVVAPPSSSPDMTSLPLSPRSPYASPMRRQSSYGTSPSLGPATSPIGTQSAIPSTSVSPPQHYSTKSGLSSAPPMLPEVMEHDDDHDDEDDGHDENLQFA